MINTCLTKNNESTDKHATSNIKQKRVTPSQRIRQHKQMTMGYHLVGGGMIPGQCPPPSGSWNLLEKSVAIRRECFCLCLRRSSSQNALGSVSWSVQLDSGPLQIHKLLHITSLVSIYMYEPPRPIWLLEVLQGARSGNICTVTSSSC